MLLICITPPETRPDEWAWCLALLAAGLDRLHVRKPTYTPRQLEGYLRPLVAGGWGERVAVHRHPDVALACGAAQVHLPHDSRHHADELRGCVRLSTSAHSVDEAVALSSLWEYALLSPIFPSISKPGYSAPFDEAQLRALPGRVACPLVALGGINAARAERVADWGWHGVAVLGTIWHRPSLRNALEELRRLQSHVSA